VNIEPASLVPPEVEWEFNSLEVADEVADDDMAVKMCRFVIEIAEVATGPGS
jgi:hypothetical protein